MSDNPAMHKEAFFLLCNRELGNGMSRQVFDSLVLPNSVIKIEARSRHFQNVIEYETWERVKDSPMARWFAPVESISSSGSVLIMAKTEPLRMEELPTKMPRFLCDFKRSNYGLYQGRVVCHDYGTNLLMEYGLTKAQWVANWSDE